MTASRETVAAPRIELTEHGPYKVSGDVAIRDTEGNVQRHGGTWYLCRCGGSRNKPFCDATHWVKGFDGAETADHGPITGRRESYLGSGITVYDDRTVCALATLAERTGGSHAYRNHRRRNDRFDISEIVERGRA